MIGAGHRTELAASARCVDPLGVLEADPLHDKAFAERVCELLVLPLGERISDSVCSRHTLHFAKHHLLNSVANPVFLLHLTKKYYTN